MGGEGSLLQEDPSVALECRQLLHKEKGVGAMLEESSTLLARYRRLLPIEKPLVFLLTYRMRLFRI